MDVMAYMLVDWMQTDMTKATERILTFGNFPKILEVSRLISLIDLVGFLCEHPFLSSVERPHEETDL